MTYPFDCWHKFDDLCERKWMDGKKLKLLRAKSWHCEEEVVIGKKLPQRRKCFSTEMLGQISFVDWNIQTSRACSL